MKVYEVEFRSEYDTWVDMFMASTLEKAIEYCQKTKNFDKDPYWWAILEHEIDNEDICTNCKLITFVSMDGVLCDSVPEECWREQDTA